MYERFVKLPKNKSFFLFGPRQTGKTTYINQIFNKNTWRIDLLKREEFIEYTKNNSLFLKQAETKIKKEKISHIVIDEIQKIPILLNEVHYLIEKYPIHFVLSGSSARKLKRGAANMLGGRAIQRFLYPFIYREVKSDFDLDDVLKFGTLPSVFQQDPIEKIETLKAYSQIYLKEEIQAEGIVRNLGGFSRFLDIASAQFAELLNYSNIARDSKVSSRVISSYYEILEDTLIGFKLLPYSKSIRKRLVNQPKFYFFDNGVTNSINQTITLQNNPLYEGKLFEQFIIQEFYRYLNYSNSEAKLFFWRTNHGAEIDLVIEKHGKLVAGIEIKYSDIITGAHLSGLRSFRQDHPNIPLFIISRVQHPYELDDVQVIPWHSYEEILELI